VPQRDRAGRTFNGPAPQRRYSAGAPGLGHGRRVALVELLYYLRMDAESRGQPRLDDEQVGLAVEVFRMLADPTRVRLLWILIGRELAVNELAAQLGRPGASVSQHLAKLRLARLVQTRRDGTSVFYRVANEHIEQLITDAVFNAEHAASTVPAHHRADDGMRRLHPDRPASDRRPT